MANTIWAILPPLIAIVLALITKEVLSSLMVGILTGALFYSNFNVIETMNVTFDIMGTKMGDNASIILFLAFLGIIVVLVTKAGGSRAYGEWAGKKIKTKSGAMLATSALGAIIFVDDYFNCLTVGTVMQPVTDAHNVSRAKLAYIIDSTAAPVCIIAPISSWAVAVGSTIQDVGADVGITNGFSAFMQTIPYNLYALLTILMVIILSVFAFDFGKMKKFADKADQGDTGREVVHKIEEVTVSEKGKVYDLLIPILCLIFLSLAMMVYTGIQACNADGIAVNVINIFGNCNVNISIVIAAFISIIISMVLYIPRKIMSFTEFMKSITEGIKSMVPAIIILILAWTLSGICASDYLQTGDYVGGLIAESGMSLMFIPPIIFIVAGVLAFATGTSWGTFGILIPIIVAIFGNAGQAGELLTITISATLAGAVFGDHISPISDTTILSSTGAGCNHLDHVSTQIPYALLVAGVCLVGYIIAGIVQSWWITLLISVALLVGALAIIKNYKKIVNYKKKDL